MLQAFIHMAGTAGWGRHKWGVTLSWQTVYISAMRLRPAHCLLPRRAELKHKENSHLEERHSSGCSSGYTKSHICKPKRLRHIQAHIKTFLGPAIQAVVEGSISLHLPHNFCQNQIITHLPHPPTTAKNWQVRGDYSTHWGTR